MLVLLLVATAYLNLLKPTGKTSNQLTQPYQSPAKKVVMIVIDSIMDEPFQSTIIENKVPALQYLLNNGQYYPRMISSYPTMSVVVDSTLLTGAYSDQHKVPGLVWFDMNENRFISYGSAQAEIRKLGVRQVLRESLFRLNHQHLSANVKTLHEELNGQTASINTLVYRGYEKKPLNVPKIVSLTGLIKEDASINGPNYFSYGLLSLINPTNKHKHAWEAFGFNDRFAADELKYLIEHNRLPSYTLAYFSDNDKEVHKKGVNVTKGIEDADKQLQEVFNSYPSWEEALKDTVWIVMGDSGQTNVLGNKEQALIDLRDLLKEYQIYKISGPVQENDQVVLGLNERMSFIYLLDEMISKENIINLLSRDDRVDNIAWQEGEKVNIVSSDYDGLLSFKPNGEYTDQYKQTWTIEGNAQILDLSMTNDKRITYNDYPDCLARLYSSFQSHSGNYLIVNAKPGYEFVGEGSPTHIGGAAHGSLHKQDTFFPMIVAGTELEPKYERIVDLKEWILRVLEQ